jgi:hypothetical protein
MAHTQVLALSAGEPGERQPIGLLEAVLTGHALDDGGGADGGPTGTSVLAKLIDDVSVETTDVRGRQHLNDLRRRETNGIGPLSFG